MGFLSKLGGLFRRGPRVRSIGPDRVPGLVEDGAVLVDVRRRREWRTERPVGAKHVPLHVIPHRAAKFDPDTPVVCICASGRRSHKAARTLAEAGVEECYTVRGGLSAWKRRGHPTER